MAPVSRPPSRGTTLLELMVALALMSIALLLAANLIAISERVGQRAAAILRDPLSSFTELWLRRDVDNATSLSSSAMTWSVLPLRMVLQNGAVVEYDLADGTLVRRELPAAGTGSTERSVLRGVVSWRWRVRSGRLVDIELRISKHRFSSSTSEPTGSGSSPPPATVETLTVARRGLGGGRTW